MRTRNTDAKLCVPARSALARSLEAQFEGGPIVSLQEMANGAQIRKLTDRQKRSHCVLELSFVVLNRRGEPRTIRRGSAHQITKGRTILHSFSPIETGPSAYPKTLEDVKGLLEKNLRIRTRKYTLRPLAIVRNLRQGIRFYFVVFAAEFAANIAPVASLETDVFEGHLPIRRRMTGAQARKVDEISTKRVDAVILRLLEGIKPPKSSRKDEVRTFIGEGRQLHDGLFLPYDVFISHASADKATFVRPLVAALDKLEIKSWYDERRIIVGDSIRRMIREGLNLSRMSVIVFSRNYYNRYWCEAESDAFFEQASRTNKRIIVISHNVKPSEVGRYDPVLGGKLILDGSMGPKKCAAQIGKVLRAVSGHRTCSFLRALNQAPLAAKYPLTT